MIYAIVLIIVILVSLIMVRIGTVGLRLTGLDPDIASFQAVSAFTGTGFTTAESDLVTKHPDRRKIVKFLIVAGNAYWATIVAMVISVFVQVGSRPVDLGMLLTFGIVTVGLLLILFVSRSRRFTRLLDRYLEKRIARSGGFKVYQIQRVLDLAGGYAISEVRVPRGSWLSGKTLADLGLNKFGILVLAIERGLRLIRAPSATTAIEENDNLICYGPVDSMTKLIENPRDVAAYGGDGPAA